MINTTITNLAYTVGRRLWFYKSVEALGVPERLADWLVDYPLRGVFWGAKLLPESNLKVAFRRGRATALYND
jgi:hypothetical protein